jgi:hypothetical protein
VNTSPTTNGTTAPVQLPALGLDAFSTLVLRLQREAPDAATRERIARGAAIVTTAGAIWETRTLGVYLIESCQQAGSYYEVTSLRCTCQDATRRGLPCKHSHAITILHAACAEASYDRAQARWLLTPRGEALLAARA